MSRRAEITMSPKEILDFLAEGRVASVATMGQHGRPHLVAMWYVPHGDGIATWTYRTAQKAANLGRLAQATVLIEAGDTYDQLRGVSMECDVELVTDTEKVTKIGMDMQFRYTPNRQLAVAGTQYVRMQAPKRIGLICTPTHIASWDHRKL